jgi:hypothetical protein
VSDSSTRSASASRSASSRDPDRLAAFEEERDFLLRSIDDLEAERRAGDIDEADYLELKDDYTVRAAEAIRAIDNYWSINRSTRTFAGRRSLATVAALLLFAVGAGLLLARAVGERGVNDQLTGSVSESMRDRVLRCQQLGADPNTLVDSLSCFDTVLDEDPQNVEALAYRGWYVVLASGTARDSGQTEVADELLVSGQAFLDRAVEADSTYPDARAFRAIVFERQGQTDRACQELTDLLALGPPPMIEQLVTPLSQRLNC